MRSAATTRKAALLLAIAGALSHSAAATAQDHTAETAEHPSPDTAETPRPSAFDHNLGIGLYGTGWAGAYLGAGGGGRIRWQPLDWLGIDLFAEALVVESPSAFRHDYPIGFHTYVPIPLTRTLRLRPFVGMCAVFSLLEPAQPDAPRADDVLFGIQAGAGLDFAPLHHFSFFLEAKAVAWLGHDRTAMSWTGSVDENYSTFGVAQLLLGTLYHFTL